MKLGFRSFVFLSSLSVHLWGFTQLMIFRISQITLDYSLLSSLRPRLLRKGNKQGWNIQLTVPKQRSYL